MDGILATQSGEDAGAAKDVDPLLDVGTYRAALAAWFEDEARSIDHLRVAKAPAEETMLRVRELQSVLFRYGWARYGWGPEVGGLGGGILHRAVMYEDLARRGFPPRAALEHLEILVPVLGRNLHKDVREWLVPRLLSGEALLCQGFSEAEAGSDLGSLRTRAVPKDGGFVLEGTKLWTSWVVWSDYCLVLARTGSVEERHRGLTAFVIDLDWPGVEGLAIKQADGEDELGELRLDEAFVPQERVLGKVGGGWDIAMEILAAERGSFAWQRHLQLLRRLESYVEECAPKGRLAEPAIDLFALRCRSARTLKAIENGWRPGPEAAVNKVLLATAEQNLLDAAEAGAELGLALGLGSGSELRADYLASRSVTVYGGTREIQKDIIARQVLGL